MSDHRVARIFSFASRPCRACFHTKTACALPGRRAVSKAITSRYRQCRNSSAHHCSSISRLNRPKHCRMQSAKLGVVPMAAFGWRFEVAVCPRQLDDGFEVKLDVVRQAGQGIGRWVLRLFDCHFTGFKSVQFLGCTVGHPHYATVFPVLHAQDQCGSRLGAVVGIWQFGEQAPDNVARSRGAPLTLH